jgi:CMP-N-acetylneuraminic acid synthetase
MIYKKFLTIIPARIGSKGLKKKNVKKFCGKKLIEWSFKAAKKCRHLDHIVASTDSKEIIKLSKKYKISAPFLRPKKISRDKTSMFEVIKHCVDFYKKKNFFFKNIVLLEPTSPIRNPGDLNKALKLFLNKKKMDSLVSVGRVNEHPYIILSIRGKYVVKPYFVNKKKYIRRQDLPKYYFPYGVVYISKTKEYLKNKSFISKSTGYFEIKNYQNIEIDNIYDFHKAEKIFKLKKLDVKL